MIDFPRTREQRAADFEFIQVKLASPEEIRSGRSARSSSPRRSTTAPSSPSATDSSASASSVR